MKTQEIASLCKEELNPALIIIRVVFVCAFGAAAKWSHAGFISVTWLGDGAGAGGQW